MRALYFGNYSYYGTGFGSGPFVMYDLENGVYRSNRTGVSNSYDPLATDGYTPSSLSLSSQYVTALGKGGTSTFALKGGDATQGSLTTMYEGLYPGGYFMRLEGGILLGIGGDNSNGGVGSFFEGAVIQGYTSDATDAALQAEIITAGYAAVPGVIRTTVYF